MILFIETVATWNNFEFGVDMTKEKTMLGLWNSHINSLAEEAEAVRKAKKEKTKAKKRLRLDKKENTPPTPLKPTGASLESASKAANRTGPSAFDDQPLGPSTFPQQRDVEGLVNFRPATQPGGYTTRGDRTCAADAVFAGTGVRVSREDLREVTKEKGDPSVAEYDQYFRDKKLPIILRKVKDFKKKGAMKAILEGRDGIYIMTVSVGVVGNNGKIINDTHALTINAFNRTIFDNAYDLKERFCRYDDTDLKSHKSVTKMLADYLFVVDIREVRVVMVQANRAHETNPLHIP
jgi:hypothetical protein